MRGCSTGRPASIDQARRTNCACVQPSGVAENVGLPGVWPGGGWSSQTCSRSSRPLLAVAAIERRRPRAAVGSPARSSYSPRSPAKGAE